MLAVILPTFNDPHRLRLALRGLALQTLPHEQFRVFVVSDGGEQTFDRPVIREAFGWGLSVVYGWLGGKQPGEFRAGQCRNVYLRQLDPQQFPRTLFLDSDCVPETNVLAEHLAYDGNPHVVVGARRHIPEDVVPQLTPEHVPQLASLVHKEDARYSLRGKVYGPVRERLAQGVRVMMLPNHRFVWSFQMSVPTAKTQQIGGFNETFRRYGGEDQELAGRLQRVGCPLLGRFDLVCYHLDHPQRTGDWKQAVARSVSQTDPVRNGGCQHGAVTD